MRFLRWLRGLIRGGEQSPSRAPRTPEASTARGEESVFWLAGKPYVALLNGSAEHDDHVVRLAGRAGLRELRLLPGETPEQFTTRTVNDLVDADVRYEILGALLLPRGELAENWTFALAENTAKHLRTVTDPEEKKVLNGLTAAFLADFIVRGLSSLVSSRTASGTAQPAQESA